MAKWLLHSYLQVALTPHPVSVHLPAPRPSAFRPHPISGCLKTLSETGKFRNNV